MSDVSFVRTDMLPEQDPPGSEVGAIGWLRHNLFSSWINGIVTLLSIYAIYFVLAGILPWVFQSVWNSGSLTECREIMTATWGQTHGHACWGVINERWLQLLFGFYPKELYGRPILSLVLLLVAITPILFNMISRRMNWFLLVLAFFVTAVLMDASVFVWILRAGFAGATLVIGYQLVTLSGADRAEQIAQGAKRLPNPLMFTAIYPFLMPWLMWGGTIWPAICTAFGFVIGYLVLRFGKAYMSELLTMIVAVAAAVIWWLVLSGYVSSGLSSVLPIGIEAVQSRQFGGFMLAILLGVVAIGCSLPIGVVLALGRQSDLVVVKFLCVGFIEFIRGVPLITLLFVASLLLNIFLPPGTNFDIILRVMIMMTFFSAAYMAEVIRGGLAALPRGQYEGADSLGLDYWQAQRLIIMPQALKVSIPGIVSTFIGIFKDTTLVSIIGLFDVIGLTQAIRADTSWNGIYWELFAFIAFLFFIVCFSMSRYSMYLERKLQTGHS
ncbi:MAG: amino acid ABC transporter permease [Rhodobacteraceae bacterium]|nr:amino acid ABC transporter permease [Paracoccaceae bacterium]